MWLGKCVNVKGILRIFSVWYNCVCVGIYDIEMFGKDYGLYCC